MSFYLFWLLCGLTGSEPRPNRLHSLVAEFHSLKARDSLGFLEMLYDKKDLRGLTAIALSKKGYFYNDAAKCAVQLLPAKGVVDYIKLFPAGSAEWESAMHGAMSHPKDCIIHYILSLMSTSKDVQARSCCYSLCGQRVWDDLKPYAVKDLFDERTVFVPNSYPTGLYSLSYYADGYIRLINK